MFTFRLVQFSKVYLNINHFHKHVRLELYTRYVNILEVIVTLKIHIRTQNSYGIFDDFNDGDGHRTERDDRKIFVESATKAQKQKN